MKGIVFLDRDGTLIHDAHYLSDERQVRLYNDVPASLSLLRRAGFKLVMISNQSGIGRGWVSFHTVDRINRKMQSLLRKKGKIRLDAMYYCPHAPWEKCGCRKPRTDLIRRALRRMRLGARPPRRSFVVGDKEIDIAMAKAMGMKGILVLTGHGRREAAQCRKLPVSRRPDFVARRFSNAAGWILKAV